MVGNAECPVNYDENTSHLKLSALAQEIYMEQITWATRKPTIMHKNQSGLSKSNALFIRPSTNIKSPQLPGALGGVRYDKKTQHTCSSFPLQSDLL
jgi:hypothetical protein